MIIDCHCHAGPGDGLSGPWDTRADLTDYLTRCTEAGITRSVVFAALQRDYRVGNAHVASEIAQRPDRLLGLLFLDGRMGAAVVDGEIRRHVRPGSGFVGIKVHRHDAPLSRTLCEAAARHRLPVLYDVAGDVATIELFAREYPQVNFIIPHLGSFADDWKAQLALIDHLQRHPNVYADTAGVRRFDLLQEAVDRAGAGKLLFGSDGPWLHPGVELAKVYALKLSAHDTRRILSGNLLRLIGNGVGLRRASPSRAACGWSVG